MKILVFSDKLGNYAELCQAAKGLGGEVAAYLTGSREDAAGVSAAKVYQAEADSAKMFEDYYETLKSVVAQEDPFVILTSATKRCKYMAARLVADWGTSALTDLSNLSIDAGAVKGTQMYYGGAGIRTVRSVGRAVVTIGAGAYEPASGQAGEVIPVAYVATANRIVRKEIRKKEGESVNLAAAKKVVGIGRGIAKKEDIAMAEALAKSIGAELGCSRPIAEGEGWMSADRYIGVSGVMLKPDVYIAVGISGQIQHTIGINSAKVVIAVNKDKNAPIFKQADYGIVGDLYKILPALTQLFQ